METTTIFDKLITLEWNDISNYRDYFTKMFKSTPAFKQKNKIDIVVMIISELLENVVKYTSNKTCFLKLEIDTNNNENNLNIIVENDRNSQSDDDYKVLLEIVDEINSYEDYNKMYLDFAQKFFNDEDHKSKFGMALMRKLTEGNLIDISNGSRFKPGTQIKLKTKI
jgi:hypothetical protein